MNIGLIDVDGHNYPSLPLMKLSAYHKQKGDHVEWYDPMFSPDMDVVYMSKVFSFSPDYPWEIRSDSIVKGGTGYCIDLVDGKEIYHKERDSVLEPSIERVMPDYSIYNNSDTAYGFLTRGCPRGCPFCHVGQKEGRKSVQAGELCDFWNRQKYIVLMDANILACKDHKRFLSEISKTNAIVDINQGVDARLLNDDNLNLLNQIRLKNIHFAWDLMEQSDSVIRGLKLYQQKGKVHKDRRRVYVLVNYNTTHEEDLYRIYHLREMGYIPYTMVYNKQNAPDKTKNLQRWTNNVIIWKSCERFEDYKPSMNKGGPHESIEPKDLQTVDPQAN